MAGSGGDLRQSKSSSLLSDSRHNTSAKQWIKLRTFGSWKVQQGTFFYVSLYKYDSIHLKLAA
jgi:hypothetical protein